MSEMRVRLVPHNPTAIVSRILDNEWIVSYRGEAKMVRGPNEDFRIEEILTGTKRDTNAFSISWPEDPMMIADIEIPGFEQEVWKSSEDISRKLIRGSLNILVCAKNIKAYFDYLLDYKSLEFDDETQLLCVLSYGTSVVISPLIESDSENCAGCFVQGLMNSHRTLALRYQREHQLHYSNEIVAARRISSAIRLAMSPESTNGLSRATVVDYSKGEVATFGVFPGENCTCNPPALSIEDWGNSYFGVAATPSIQPSYFRPLDLIATQIHSQPKVVSGACSEIESEAKKRTLCESIERFVLASTCSPVTRIAKTDFSVRNDICEMENLLRQEFDVVDAFRGSPFGEVVMVPSDLFLPNRGEKESSISSWGKSKGSGAGSSLPRAFESSFLELIERDALSRLWLSESTFRLDAGILGDSILNRCELLGYEVLLTVVSGYGEIPLVVAILLARNGGNASLGMSAKLDLSSAALHALEEASLMLQDPSQQDPTRQELFELGEHCKGLGMIESVKWFSNGNLSMAMQALNPIVFRYRNRMARAAGIEVVASWSPIAASLCFTEELLSNVPQECRPIYHPWSGYLRNVTLGTTKR